MKATVIPSILVCALLSGACTPASAGVAVSGAAPTPAATRFPTETPLPTAPPLQATEAVTATLAAENLVGSDPPTPVAQEETTTDAALLALGMETYRQQTCGVCHVLAAVESQGTFGPPHDNLAVIAAERLREDRYNGAASTPEGYIRESIVNPLVFLVDGYQITRFPMPIFINLSEREVDALVYLLMQPPASTP